MKKKNYFSILLILVVSLTMSLSGCSKINPLIDKIKGNKGDSGNEESVKESGPDILPLGFAIDVIDLPIIPEGEISIAYADTDGTEEGRVEVLHCREVGEFSVLIHVEYTDGTLFEDIYNYIVEGNEENSEAPIADELSEWQYSILTDENYTNTVLRNNSGTDAITISLPNNWIVEEYTIDMDGEFNGLLAVAGEEIYSIALIDEVAYNYFCDLAVNKLKEDINSAVKYIQDNTDKDISEWVESQTNEELIKSVTHSEGPITVVLRDTSESLDNGHYFVHSLEYKPTEDITVARRISDGGVYAKTNNGNYVYVHSTRGDNFSNDWSKYSIEDFLNSNIIDVITKKVTEEELNAITTNNVEVDESILDASSMFKYVIAGDMSSYSTPVEESGGGTSDSSITEETNQEVTTKLLLRYSEVYPSLFSITEQTVIARRWVYTWKDGSDFNGSITMNGKTITGGSSGSSSDSYVNESSNWAGESTNGAADNNSNGEGTIGDDKDSMVLTTTYGNFMVKSSNGFEIGNDSTSSKVTLNYYERKYDVQAATAAIVEKYLLVCIFDTNHLDNKEAYIVKGNTNMCELGSYTLYYLEYKLNGINCRSEYMGVITLSNGYLIITPDSIKAGEDNIRSLIIECIR